MKQIPVSLSELYNRRLPLGRVGENQHVQIVFQCNAIFADYPNATTLLIVTAPGGESYAPEIEKDGTNVLWTVTDSDLAKEGGGELQLTFTNGQEIIKSYIGKTQIFRSIAENGEIPTPIDLWIERANETVRQAAQDAADATVEDLADTKEACIEEIEQAGEDTRASIPSDYSKLSNDVTSLKSALNELPKIVETEEDDADLYITDKDGHVLAQFSGGHIQTKEFDSADVGDLSSLETSDKRTLVNAINDVRSKTPSNAPSMEITDSDASLDIVDNSGNVILRLKGGHIQTKEFDSSDAKYTPPIQYKFSEGNLLLSYGYNSENDAVVVFNVGRANSLFDFSAFCMIPKGASLDDYERSTLSQVWASGTDMHSPFQFNAVNNPDGYYASATDPSYSGGNHTQTIDGNVVKTASSKYVHYFADGVQVSNGYGRCTHFEIRWANNIQAYNCIKADGTGRTSLITHHDMIFDGVRFEESVSLEPTEDILMQYHEGFATVGWNSVYTSIQFLDAVNRGIYPSTASEQPRSGNNTTSGMILSGPSHSLEMRIDTNFGLGKREYYSGDRGAFTASYGKAYFMLIEKGSASMVSMPQSNVFYYRGSFRFYPTVV